MPQAKLVAAAGGYRSTSSNQVQITLPTVLEGGGEWVPEPTDLVVVWVANRTGTETNYFIGPTGWTSPSVNQLARIDYGGRVGVAWRTAGESAPGAGDALVAGGTVTATWSAGASFGNTLFGAAVMRGTNTTAEGLTAMLAHRESSNSGNYGGSISTPGDANASASGPRLMFWVQGSANNKSGVLPTLTNSDALAYFRQHSPDPVPSSNGPVASVAAHRFTDASVLPGRRYVGYNNNVDGSNANYASLTILIPEPTLPPVSAVKVGSEVVDASATHDDAGQVTVGKTSGTGTVVVTYVGTDPNRRIAHVATSGGDAVVRVTAASGTGHVDLTFSPPATSSTSGTRRKRWSGTTFA